MDIPHHLLGELKSGRVVLVLGAGALVGASRKDVSAVPLGLDLRDLLADHFLGGKYKREALSYVAGIAISESSLATVQDYIAEVLSDLKPATFHGLLPTFRWRGVATTNYDRLLEDVYSKETKRIQELAPFLGNSDRVDEKLRSPNHLAYLKLHGCISRTRDDRLPLILTSDQYLTHRRHRTRLYDLLKEWCYENPLVFVGHSMGDSDLQAILLELLEEQALRPRFYLIRPCPQPEEIRFWEQKKITMLSGTFKEFLERLDDLVPPNKRQVLKLKDTAEPIEERFVVKEHASTALLEFLEREVQYVRPGMPLAVDNPERFYRGFDLGWYAIENELDVRRSLVERMLRDIIICPEEDRPTHAELFVVRAEAGAGKSVFLRRLAWEASRDAGVLCLYVVAGGSVSVARLVELQRCTGERLFLFWDDAAEHAAEMAELLSEAQSASVRLTVLTAERSNAWNMSCEVLDDHLTEAYDLRYLNHEEVIELVARLEEHQCLGPNLEGRPSEERVREFEERTGRQILVALHEATRGLPFQEILLDEFREIEPERARRLYLTVCALFRFNVTVRAGLISRIHGIPFTEFKEEFFGPLDHVVMVKQDRRTQDIEYVARHPEIAQIVFDVALGDPADRYNEYVHLLEGLNLAYSGDLVAFRRLLRAHDLVKHFPRHEDVVSLYSAAESRADEDAYVLQQWANYERIRPGGNLRRSRELLDRARTVAPRDPSILHSLAEVVREEAERAETRLLREKLRSEAKRILEPLIGARDDDRYARHTLIKLALSELRDALADDKARERDIDEAIRAAERKIGSAAQRYPNDELFLRSEAELSTLLKDHERAVEALKRAVAKNPRDPFLAGRLARVLRQRGDQEGALSTLRQALDLNRGDLELNYLYASVLRAQRRADSGELSYHFRRSFVKWDARHEAQFWFARFAFESDSSKDREDSKEVFRRLRSVPMRHALRHEIRDTIDERGRAVRFTGLVSRLEESHGFVARDGLGDWIFFHRANQDTAVWEILRKDARVEFEIGFSFGGAKALRMKAI